MSLAGTSTAMWVSAIKVTYKTVSAISLVVPTCMSTTNPR